MIAAASVLSPPSERDFEIQRLHLVEHLSTWRIAEMYGISQTRVRQVVHRVCRWLAGVLPAPTEVEQEQESRLARHLAADQLQSQIEKLQTFWDQTHDPKFLRQLTRAVLALAKLGIVPGTIGAVAADALDEECSFDVPPVTIRREASFSPQCNEKQPQSARETNRPDRTIQTPNNPLNGDCSRDGDDDGRDESFPADREDVSLGSATDWERDRSLMHDQIAGLNIMEQRLLTLLAGVPADDAKERQELEQTLVKVRIERAELELRLSRPLGNPTVLATG